MTDYYKVLGINSQASDKEIKHSYRRLAKEYHPDVVGNDEQKTKKMYEIQEAYKVLGDPLSRKAYDEKWAQKRNGLNTGRQTDGDKHEPAPDMGRFEQFFGFQPGKGMETYHDKKSGIINPKDPMKPKEPMKPEEMFASFFGKK